MTRARGAMLDHIRDERGDERAASQPPRRDDGIVLEEIAQRRHRPTPEASLAAEAMQLVRAAGKELSDRHWTVLRMRYGSRSLTQREVAQELGLSEPRISQLEAEALALLRAALHLGRVLPET